MYFVTFETWFEIKLCIEICWTQIHCIKSRAAINKSFLSQLTAAFLSQSVVSLQEKNQEQIW